MYKLTLITKLLAVQMGNVLHWLKFIQVATRTSMRCWLPTEVATRLILFIYLFIWGGYDIAFNTVQVISRRAAGRAEETSIHSWFRFSTVNCRPSVSNYQCSPLRSGRAANPNLRGGNSVREPASKKVYRCTIKNLPRRFSRKIFLFPGGSLYIEIITILPQMDFLTVSVFFLQTLDFNKN